MNLGRALLFCPADRPDRYAKALAVADAVILDLEDAVAPADKAAARRSVVAAADLDPNRVIVRVNPAGTDEHEHDLAALESGPFRQLMLAKTEAIAPLDRLAAAGFTVIALCETARGVQEAPTIAQHPAVRALMCGVEDLIASMSGRSSRRPDGSYRDVARYARSRVLIAAHVAGKSAIDAVHLNIVDLDGQRAEAEDAAASGFSSTACIHPSQVPIVRRAYASTADEREWAQAVLEESSRQPAVFKFRGRMVDEPVLRHARQILES